MEKTIAVLGGDRRMALLARLLAEDGHPVRTWGLAAFGMEDTAVFPFAVLVNRRIVVCPRRETIEAERDDALAVGDDRSDLA